MKNLAIIALGAVPFLFAFNACTPKSEKTESNTPSTSDGTGTSKPSSAPTSQPKKTGKLLDESHWKHHLAGVSDGNVVAASAVLSAPEKYAGQRIRVEGPIHSVCEKAGCWLRVGEGDKSIHVSFDPYSKEKDLIGADGAIVLEGKLEVTETSVDKLKHFAEDAGKSAEEIAKITEPKVEAKLVATGYARPAH